MGYLWRVKQLIRILLSSLFCTTILLQQFSALPMLLAFQLNRSEISKRFCENKNAPEKHCCGKCYLQKQLKENEHKQKPLGTSVREAQVLLFFESLTSVHHNNNYHFFSNLRPDSTLMHAISSMQLDTPPPEAMV
jgi:hypothetical protein